MTATAPAITASPEPPPYTSLDPLIPNGGARMVDTVVIIPTYNEITNLAEMTKRTLEATDRVDILVVDDNSPDGTGALADTLAAASARIHVLHRARKSGLGDAYRAGFAWGIAAGYEFFVEMDGDGSHRPEQLPDLIAARERADVVVGSRWVPGGGVSNWALRRIALSRAGSLYARVALNLPFRDITGGYRVYSARALAAVNYSSVQSQGYCFQIEMLWRANEARLRIVELPIQFAERISGTSKMDLAIVIEAMTRVTRWGIGTRARRIGRTVLRRSADSLTGDAHHSDRAPLHGGLASAHRVNGRD